MPPFDGIRSRPLYSGERERIYLSKTSSLCCTICWRFQHALGVGVLCGICSMLIRCGRCIFPDQLWPAVDPLDRVMSQTALAFEFLRHCFAQTLQRDLCVGHRLSTSWLAGRRSTHDFTCSSKWAIQLLSCTTRCMPDCSNISSGWAPVFMKHCA